LAIHSTAIIDPKAQLDSSVEVGPYCVIDANVRVAAGCVLMHNVYLTGWTEIGENNTLHPGVIVGHSPQDIKYHGARSYCRIGRDNILREYVTIHRGTDPESVTTVGDGCFFLAGSHVGHNGVVGDNVTLINSAMLAGHVSVGDRAIIGGGAGVHQFVRIGELSMIKGTAAVVMDIIPYALVGTDGRVAGVNTVGLRRAGLGREERLEVRSAYRVLFGKNARFRAAVEQLADTLTTPAGRRLLVFLRAESKRGFAGSCRKRQPGTDGRYPE
jgi:UDP-N-acetylglucosamine acyltransferase